MVQEYKNICIIGAGASGCICAYFLLKAGLDVTLFDYGQPLRTLLPTGGGRCNLGHAEYDFKELAKNYPRGEKFLYSVFSKFATYNTVDLFDELGIKTYTQEDLRIFPISNSSKNVRNIILNKIKQADFIKERVLQIIPKDSEFVIKTNKAEYLFSHCIISTGGKGQIQGINHAVTALYPSLIGLKTSEIFKDLSGLTLKNVYSKDCKFSEDILFTHFGVSGPLIYKISSIFAERQFPYKLELDLCKQNFDLQADLNNSPHKELKNILSKYVPERLSRYLLKENSEIKAHNVNSTLRDSILDTIHNFTINITGTDKGEEIVTAGGYNLDEINQKTMESKLYPKLYFTGEVLNIDGFCGGFNLQSAWSTAFVASEAIINS